jgi:secretion/DNA translocation related TadE-like protein
VNIFANQNGSGTIHGISTVFCAVFASVAVAGIVNLLHSSLSAKNIADVSALAAAKELQDGGEPCEMARIIADKNDAVVIQCDVNQTDVKVKIQQNDKIFITASAVAGETKLGCPQ